MIQAQNSLVAILVSCALSGCTVKSLQELVAEAGENSCSEDSDCESRVCDPRFAACVSEGGIDSVLLEIVPPASVRNYGGLHFFQHASGFTRSSTDLRLVLPTPTSVSGKLVFSTPQAAICPQAGATTLPVRVTFTPQHATLGLGVVKYHGTSRVVAGEHVFELSLPDGSYDVYLEPALDSDAEGDAGAISSQCAAVPQLNRGVQITGESVELTFSQAVPQALQVVLASQARFDGWQVDLIHPVTGEILSTRSELALHQPSDGPVDYRTSILYSLVSGQDYAPLGQELVRLTPPADTVGPVVLMHRAGLEVFTPGTARIEQLEPFGALVDFEGWVLQRGNAEVEAPGTVTFAATALSGVPAGVFASFEVTSEVEADGQVRARLLPGEYRVRTEPAPESGFAASESALLILPTENSAAPQAVQAGQVIEVPRAVAVSGRVDLPRGVDSLVGSEVFAESARSGACANAEGEIIGSCRGVIDPVLSKALAEDPFVPRTAVGLVDDRARFTVTEVDCGACEPGAGALFDVSLRPPQSTRLPWVIRTGISVDADLDLGQIAVAPPVIQRGQLRISGPSCIAAPEACVLPGAQLRAFVVIDDLGQVVDDPALLPSCAVTFAGSASSASQSGDSRCARAAIQVAEVRSNDTGGFELLLPPTLD